MIELFYFAGHLLSDFNFGTYAYRSSTEEVKLGQSSYEDPIDTFWYLLGDLDEKNVEIVRWLMDRNIDFRIRAIPTSEMALNSDRYYWGWYNKCRYEIVIPNEDEAMLVKLSLNYE